MADSLAVAFCPHCLSKVGRIKACGRCGYEFNHRPLTIREMLEGKDDLYQRPDLYNQVNLPAFVRVVAAYLQAEE